MCSIFPLTKLLIFISLIVTDLNYCMINSRSINSPIRYAGGKFYARKLILEHIPFHSYYIEPFAGGASVFFAKPKVKYNRLNDLDTGLVNLFTTIRDKPKELIELLLVDNHKKLGIPPDLIGEKTEGEILPANKELHGFFKSHFHPRNELEQAFRWYYLNRTSYSGIMNYKNMYWGYGDKYSMQPQNWPRSIIQTSEKLQDVVLTNEDFETVIDQAPNGSLLFIDPPYYNADQDKFYSCIFTKEDHVRLEQCLHRNKERLFLFLTYDNCSEVRELFHWMPETHDKEWNYCIQRTDDQKNGSKKRGQRYKGKEIFLLNYSDSLYNTTEEQIKLFFKEKKIKYAAR